MSVSFPELDELESKLAARQKAAADFLTEAKDGGDTIDLSKVKSVPGSNVEKAAWFKNLNDEMGDLATKAAPLRALKAMADGTAEGEQWTTHTEPGAGERKPTKSIGAQFAKSAARTQMGVKVDLDVDVKTLMTRAAGWAPESIREAGYLPAASAPVMFFDQIPLLPTRQAAVKYMEQTTRTNNAAERAEGAAYGEAAFALTERSVTIESIGVWLPVTDEQLEDEEEAAAMIDLELPMMLDQRLDLQGLVGDGNTPNVLGVNNKASIQTQAKGADPVFDAIHKGITKVRVTGRANPDLVVFHPNDWEGLVLTRTADGIYILGNPASETPKSIWGLRPIISDNQTENTAVVGDFRGYARFYLRRGVEVLRTNSHASQFIEGEQAIRASVRGAFVWKRAAAFCQVTGI